MTTEMRWETDTLGGRLGWAIKRQPNEGKSRGVGLLKTKLEKRKAPGANYPSISSYLKDDVDPPLAFIQAAADALGIRKVWLAYGEGAPTEEEERRRVGNEEDDPSSPYALILRAIPDLERLEDLSPTVCATFVEYVIRLEEKIVELGGNPEAVNLEALATAAWDSMLKPMGWWKKRTIQPTDPIGFADYAMAMLNALSLSLSLAVTDGSPSVEDQMRESPNGEEE